MAQVLHGARHTPEAIRRAVRHSEESLRALAKRYGIDQRTVAKWKKRKTIVDLPTGPKSLSIEFRQHLARVWAYAMTCNEARIVSVPLNLAYGRTLNRCLKHSCFSSHRKA